MRTSIAGARQSWLGMKGRCNHKGNVSYKHYGGRGITYDPRWEDFKEFLKDMGSRPEGLTLERNDTNGNYCKENCRWATRQEQNLSRRPYTVPRKDNKFRIVGVSWDNGRNVYIAKGSRNMHTYVMYQGNDFFEACCRRKSWENYCE